MDDIRELVERLNDSWRSGRTDELTELFHPEVVVVAPGFEARVVGRDAVVQSYRDFFEQAVLHDFAMAAPDVDEFGTTAVASCRYTVDYEIEGRRWRGSGHDLLVLRKEDTGWKIVWRTVLAGEEEEVTAESPD